MTQITLSDEQVNALQQGGDYVFFCDNEGKPLGTFRKLTISPERLAILESRIDSSGPWLTTAEVLAQVTASETNVK